MSHHDLLDEQERLGGPLVGSLALHVGIVGFLILLRVVHPFGQVEHWGDPNGGRFGAVAVTAVPSIALPSRSSTPNPVANDTESQVPAPPSKQKAQPKVQQPDPKAIALRSRNAKERRVREAAPAPNQWADKQQYRPNQVYSSVGPAAGSPLYQMQGGGGVGVGTNSPFGTRFGYYADLLRANVSSKWHPDPSRAQSQVVVQFTIRRDGSLAPGLPRIVQTSGDGNLDRSAQRAIMDAAPFPQLPNGFDRSEATVELTFVARR